MSKNKGVPEGTPGLRRQAEDRLKEEGLRTVVPSEADTNRMLHELQVHQIELELQNEELKRAREELELQFEKYSDLYNFAPVGYFTLDVNGTIREANLTGATLLGIDRSRLVGSRFALLVSHDSRPAFDLFMTRVFAGMSRETCEVVLQGDRLRYVQLEGAAAESVPGAARQCRLALIDITRRMQAEESLRRYELLSQNSRDIVLLIRGDDGRILEANAAALNAYGYSRDELLRMIVYNLRVVETHGQTVSQMLQADAKGILFETVHHRKDGTTFPVEVNSQGATIAGTRTLISVIRDITERKRMEEELRQNEQLHRAIGESINYGVWVCSPDGRNTYASESFLKLVGLTQDECSSFGWGNVLHPDDAEKTIAAWQECVRTEGVWDKEHRYRGVDGRWHHVLARGIPVRDEQGRIICWAGINLDIDRQKQLEEALRNHQEELETTNRQLRKIGHELERRVQERTEELQQAYDQLKKEVAERQRAEAELRQSQKMEAMGTLAGGIAHDFNNILAAIIGFAEMAKDKTPEESPAWRHIDRVVAGGIRGRELVKRILTFSRRADQEKQPIKLAVIVKEALRLLRASLPATIDIRSNIETDLGFVLADPIHIQQVVMNLCTNAAYAMRLTGGTISVDIARFSLSSSHAAPDSTMIPGLYDRLSVLDTGEGMSPDILEHIFDPFFTTKAPGDGTGLGLSVVHGIVASHGGTITVLTEPGKGSNFTVYLPVIPEKQVQTPGDKDNAIPGGHERILFVDDEEDLAVIGHEMLTGMGYRVTHKTRPREALALFRLDPSRFDLVITDQTMPEMTGKELVKEILTLRADTPVIMCTGFSHLVDADSAKAAGIKAFVMKPLTKKEIAQAIRTALDE